MVGSKDGSLRDYTAGREPRQQNVIGTTSGHLSPGQSVKQGEGGGGGEGRGGGEKWGKRAGVCLFIMTAYVKKYCMCPFRNIL